MSDIDFVFKILLVGDSGVGKSSILLQFTDGYFNENLGSTIGVDFRIKIMSLEDSDGNTKKVKATIWDTAGQERFRTLTSAYYRGAQGVIFVYDVSRKESFDELDSWLNEVTTYAADAGKHLVKVLLGNKIDRDAVVKKGDAVRWAEDHGMLFLQSSAKTTEGISNVFEEVVRKILESPELLQRMTEARQASQISVQSSGKKTGCC
jgi:Ras-related protein Rab-18